MALESTVINNKSNGRKNDKERPDKSNRISIYRTYDWYCTNERFNGEQYKANDKGQINV